MSRVQHVTIQIFKDRSGEDWRWTMRHRNGLIVGASTEGYRRRAGAVANIALVTGIEMPKGSMLVKASMRMRSWSER
jgi:uncharacterized protein YegP (UPF0339 family)